jgi:ubiquinol-cytochrome c reductase cytochrome b/c1 subunit
MTAAPCSAALSHIAFHNLDEPGGPGFTEAQAKALAAAYKLPADPNDRGEIFDDKGNRLTRAGVLADYFPPPFPNEEAARAANSGALPPDLSMVVKAREGGPQYVYSIITGFHQTPPAGFKVTANKYYNPYFEGWNISMPPPLNANSVTYSDGTKATVDQEAHDVATFLSWASDPKMEERKQMGFGVIAFLVVLAGILFVAYRRVWADAH